MNHQRHERRGLIILLVLSLLVLFVMLGATLLVVSTRARTSARAFLAASDKSEAAVPILPRTILDEALLLLIRGSRDPGPPTPAGAETVVRESLLGDMYGYTNNANATEENRVPFRDGRADATPLPPPYGEPYDAFDDDNPFLSQISSNGTVLRAAFQPVGFSGNYVVDNDGDSVPDGLWFSTTSNGTRLFGNATSSTGSQLSFRVSYLVLDLDGRVNVNAHGGSGTPTPVGPASLDPSTVGIGSGTLDRIRSGSAPGRGNGTTQTPPIIPENWRQSPLLSSLRSVPGRGGEPYTLRLDRNANAQADLTGSVPANNPFTLSELERVLRPFDSDWAALPPRLASMVTDLDGAARRTVTTDSWDVPFTTGLAAPPAGAPIRPKFDLTGQLWGARPGGLDKTNPTDKEKYATELYACLKAIFPGSIPPAGTEQWCANVAEHWGYAAANPSPGNMTFTTSNVTVQGVAPTVVPGEAAKWDGIGILSAADLLAVPKGSKSEIETWLDPMAPQPVVSLAAEAGNQRILEAVGMPSPFTATTQNDLQRYLMISGNLTGNGTVSGNVSVREPGRVNVNTCSDEVWDEVWGGAAPARGAAPMESTWDVLKGAVDNGSDVRAVDRDKANRLALCATVRSNVYAIWITLEVKDNSLDAGPPTLHRLFAIVDRSIPVNYARGVNTVAGPSGSARPNIDPPVLDPVPVTTDVRNVIRIKRYLN